MSLRSGIDLYLRRKGIIVKIIITLASVVLVIIALSVFYFSTTSARASRQNLQQVIASISVISRLGYSAPLWNLSHEDIENLNQVLLSNRDVVAINIYEGQQLTSSLSKDLATGKIGKPATKPYSVPAGEADIRKISDDILYEGKKIGMFEMFYTERYVNEAITHANVKLAISFLIIALAIILVLFLIVRRSLINPILSLARMFGEVSRSEDFTLRATKQADDEIGFLYDRFNAMLGEIDTGRAAIRKMNLELEARVLERTSQLEVANRDLRSTTEQLEKAYQELKTAHSQMVQQEKMASIGQLAAGVAHEINNPMGFIIGNLGTLGKYVTRLNEFVEAQSAYIRSVNDGVLAQELDDRKKQLKLDFIIRDADALIEESLEGANRVKNIVQDLKRFSRIDGMEHEEADINLGLETTIKIAWNELKYKATVNRDYGDIPLTLCNMGQINQVFLNILINAVQSIERQGEITAKTWHDGSFIYISISDTGCGIPEDRLSKVFDPFYTTKEIGEGTGLGLSIAYDIAKKHDGDITIDSEVGKGTVFTIKVPIRTRTSLE